MYQEKVNKILLVNKYLIYCKMKEPHSEKTRRVQNYLTEKINQTLNSHPKQTFFLFSILPFLSFR